MLMTAAASSVLISQLWNITFNQFDIDVRLNLNGEIMRILNVLSYALVLNVVSCSNLDVSSLTGVMKSFDSKEMNYHDMSIYSMKVNKVKANSFVDTYLASFQSEEYDKFKDDELTYDEKIKSSTVKLQKTIDQFVLKPYKLQYNYTVGKYDAAKECFVMGDNILTTDGYLSKGDYFGLQFDPLIIDSSKSTMTLPPVLKIRPKDKNQFACIKVPKSLAGQITSLGDETARNTEIRFDFDVVSVGLKTMTYRRNKAPTKLQYIHKINPGTEDIQVKGYEAIVNVKTVRVFKPGYQDQILSMYNIP